jgi:hypothetical protein
MPLARSNPVLYGLKVLVRHGEVGPDSNAPTDGTAMYARRGGRRLNNNGKKRPTTNFIKISLHAQIYATPTPLLNVI